MGVRSKRLFGPVTASGAGVVIYTVPAGRTGLLKTITLVNAAAVTNSFALYLNGSAAANLFLRTTIPANDGVALAQLEIALHPGDTLRAFASLASIVVAGFGAELDGVAP